MILPSRRYVLPAVTLLLCAAVPALLGSVRPRLHDPCADPQALRETGEIPDSRDGGERLAKLGPQLTQWSEGTILTREGEKTPLRFHVIRDYDGSRFFTRPFSGAVENFEPETRGSHRLDTAVGPVKVHRVTDGSTAFTAGGRGMAQWVFLYGNRPVDSALFAKLGHVFQELHEGRQPITLLLVSGRLPTGRVDRLLERADDWLRDAVERHVAVCEGV